MGMYGFRVRPPYVQSQKDKPAVRISRSVLHKQTIAAQLCRKSDICPLCSIPSLLFLLPMLRRLWASVNESKTKRKPIVSTTIAAFVPVNID